MFIAINGQLGSGKSEVCRWLEKNHCFKVFSTGRIQREYAISNGISTLEQNQKSKEDHSLDHIIDNKLLEFAEQNLGLNVVFDSRLAFHFVRDSFKVHLLVNPSVAAKRVYLNRNTSEEQYNNETEAMYRLVERRRLERDRYISIYGVDMSDLVHYDLIIDTTTLSIDEVCEIVFSEYQKFVNGNREKTFIISPQNVYPTEGIRNINMDRVYKYCSDFESEGELQQLIELAQVDDSLFVMDGHHRIMAANQKEVKSLKAILLYDKDAILPAGVTPEKYITISLSDIYDWEDANRFIYGYYPDVIKRERY